MCLVPAPLYTVCACPRGSYIIIVISRRILCVEPRRPCTLYVPAHMGRLPLPEIEGHVSDDALPTQCDVY